MKWAIFFPDNENPCDTNTVFRSIIISGTVRMIDDKNTKEKILKAIVEKYTPQLSHLSFPEKMLKATGIIKIIPVQMTGKYYK